MMRIIKITIILFLGISNIYSQSSISGDTLYFNDSVYTCLDGLILEPGRLPDPSYKKYKCFISEYNNFAILIWEENDFARISFYQRNPIICLGFKLFSWDELPINFNLPINTCTKEIFLDDVLLQNKREVKVIYK